MTLYFQKYVVDCGCLLLYANETVNHTKYVKQIFDDCTDIQRNRNIRHDDVIFFIMNSFVVGRCVRRFCTNKSYCTE